jgi:gluconolactonase
MLNFYHYKFIDPLSFAVLGENGTFRNSSQLFNPTNTSPPFFQIFTDEFVSVLGKNASIRLIAQNESFSFGYEAPIWVPESDEVCELQYTEELT